jgi:hypothetical protein
MDLDLTIRYSDDRYARSSLPDLTPQHRFIGLSPAEQTSVRASPRRCVKRDSCLTMTLGPIGTLTHPVLIRRGAPPTVTIAALSSRKNLLRMSAFH